MVKAFIYIITVFVALNAHAQAVLTPAQEQQLERLVEREEAIMEDESLLQQLEAFQKNPLNLNTADVAELEQLQVLTALQIKALLHYRALMGNLIHIYELQAIPYWDVVTIRKLLPFITIHEKVNVANDLSARLRGGEHQLLFRFSRSFIDTNAADHQGSPDKILVRYRYTYKNLLQFGLLGDKDAGEPLFKGEQRRGFDFYSFHLFAKNIGIVQSLVIGDFTVNLGQGLIQWQSLALGKSTEITAIKRQSAILRPYSSAGEHNFHRGLGLTLRKKKVQLTVFGSFRKLDANLSQDASGQAFISSFLTSGLHRTLSESANRNNVRSRVTGGNLSYRYKNGKIGLNVIHHHFSFPVHRREEPYNLFSFRGRQLANYSIDYDHTWQNLHFFGELAAGPNFSKAMLHGLLVSLDRRADVSLVYRRLEPGFQSINAGAFTENSLPSNESGLFIGLSLKPWQGFRVDAYADVFRFPWLKFRTDAPSMGREYLLHFAWQPHKRLEISTRFRDEIKAGNTPAPGARMNTITGIPRTNWRVHVDWQPNRDIRVQQRIELVWYDKQGGRAEEGYLIYNDISWQPSGRLLTIGGRLQFFETNGFNSRIYAFESDVAAGYSVTAIYQKGLRYYLNFKVRLFPDAAQVKIFQQIMPSHISFRLSQTFMGGPPNAEFQRSTQSECRLQFIFSLF